MKVKPIIKFSICLLFASSLIACHYPDLSPDLLYSIIDGQHIKNELIADSKNTLGRFNDHTTVYDDIIIPYTILEEPLAKLNVNVDLLKKVDNNGDIVYLAIGGTPRRATGSGYMNGGINREGLIFSYPNLLSKQLGISNFHLPHFDSEEYNGTGKKILSTLNLTDTALPKFEYAKNNLADFEYLEVSYKSRKISYFKKASLIVDNYTGFGFSYPVLGSQFVGEPFTLESVQSGYNTRLKFSSENKTKSLDEEIRLRNDVDFFSIEIGQGFEPETPYKYSGEKAALRVFKERGLKGIIIISPNFTVPPIQRMITWSDVKRLSTLNVIYNKIGENNIRAGGIPDEFWMLPTSEIDSLISSKVNISLKRGASPSLPLLHIFGIGAHLRTSKFEYDQAIEKLKKSKEISAYPIVNLKIFVDELIEEGSIIIDGVTVSAAYPGGNFYSDDGYSLSPFGQAVITNEIIKGINEFYETEIPLLNTRHFK